MDPVLKIWMYENWIGDQIDKNELAKSHAYLLASFSNPEVVQKILGEDGSIESTDEEFDETSKMIKNINIKNIEKNNGARRRRLRLRE